MLLLNRATERHKELECSGSGSQDQRAGNLNVCYLTPHFGNRTDLVRDTLRKRVLIFKNDRRKNDISAGGSNLGVQSSV
jgi:hypothetical protein